MYDWQWTTSITVIFSYAAMNHYGSLFTYMDTISVDVSTMVTNLHQRMIILADLYDTFERSRLTMHHYV